MGYEIRTVYAAADDMTFIIADGDGFTEVIGWYWGEPNDWATKLFAGKLRAEY